MALNIVAGFMVVLLAGCGAPETSARAESIPANTPTPSVTPGIEADIAPATSPSETPSSGPADAPSRAAAHSPDALERLKAQLSEIAAEPAQEIAPVTSEAETATPDTPAPEEQPDDIETLRGEVKDLRREVARLQETVDAALAYLIGELGDENRRLKKDIASPDVIEQDKELVEQAPPVEPEQPATAPVAHADYGKDGYLSLKEWGRTPEQAKELGGNVSSLRGMICAVSPGTTDEELKAIGKRLRDTCVGYDNMNIDIFDDEAAARDFVERNVRSSTHYVMNITRHKASGQDVMVFVRQNGAREVVVE